MCFSSWRISSLDPLGSWTVTECPSSSTSVGSGIYVTAASIRHFPQTGMRLVDDVSAPLLFDGAVVECIRILLCVGGDATVVEEAALVENFEHGVVVFEVRRSEANDFRLGDSC